MVAILNTTPRWKCHSQSFYHIDKLSNGIAQSFGSNILLLGFCGKCYNLLAHVLERFQLSSFGQCTCLSYYLHALPVLPLLCRNKVSILLCGVAQHQPFLLRL